MATFLRTRGQLQVLGQGTPSLVTHYWDSAGGSGVALATEAVARVRAFWNSFAAWVGSGSTWTPNLVVDEIEETTGALVNQYAASAPAGVAFTATGDALPLFTQGLLRYGTAAFIDGRRVQGRTYVPGVVESSSAGNPAAPIPAYITALNTAAALLGTTIITPMSQRVWHRPGPRGAGLSAPVITRQAANTWAVLKSRRT